MENIILVSIAFTTTSINVKLESLETVETMEKAEVTTFSNDKLTISKPKLLNLEHMKTKVAEGTEKIHQDDIKGLLMLIDVSLVVEFQRWKVLKSKIFGQESPYSKEIFF